MLFNLFIARSNNNNSFNLQCHKRQEYCYLPFKIIIVLKSFFEIVPTIFDWFNYDVISPESRNFDYSLVCKLFISLFDRYISLSKLKTSVRMFFTIFSGYLAFLNVSGISNHWFCGLSLESIIMLLQDFEVSRRVPTLAIYSIFLFI